MCINPLLKIVPSKITIYSCFSTALKSVPSCITYIQYICVYYFIVLGGMDGLEWEGE